MGKITKPTGNVRLTSVINSNGVRFFITKYGTKSSIFYSDISSKIIPISHKINVICFTIFVILMTRQLFGLFFGLKTGLLGFISFLSLNIVVLSLPLTIWVLRKKGDKQIISFCGYNAAKNVVENAYYSLGHIPSPGELSNYSTWSYNDVYLYNDGLVIIATYFAFLFLLTPLYKILGSVGVIFILLFLQKKKRIFFLQSLITIEPSNKQYIEVIDSLDNLLSKL